MVLYLLKIYILIMHTLAIAGKFVTGSWWKNQIFHELCINIPANNINVSVSLPTRQCWFFFFFETQTVVSIQNLTLTGCLHESRNGIKTRRDNFFKCLNGDFYKPDLVIRRGVGRGGGGFLSGLFRNIELHKFFYNFSSWWKLWIKKLFHIEHLSLTQIVWFFWKI